MGFNDPMTSPTQICGKRFTKEEDLTVLVFGMVFGPSRNMAAVYGNKKDAAEYHPSIVNTPRRALKPLAWSTS
jgi:hypothetical protein